MAFELRIRNRYYKAHLGKDDDWFMTLDQDVTFNLRVLEVYKVRMESIGLIQEFDVPF